MMGQASRHGFGHEMDFWSVFLGCDATRISLADDRGQEYFCIVRNEGGKAWTEARKKAREALAWAIDTDQPPGEVRWR